FKWWLLVSANIVIFVGSLISGTLLLRFYFQNGGQSLWMGSLTQSMAFPLLLIFHFFFTFCFRRSNSDEPSPPYSVSLLITMYTVMGIIYGGANALFAVGLSYLSASTFALITTTQIGFISIFSFFINRQRMTPLIVNSIVILALASSLVAVNSGSDEPAGVSHAKYLLGIFSTMLSVCLYALMLSLSQFTFEKVRKKHSYSTVIEQSIWCFLVATVVSLVGFFVSGQWKTIADEMSGFQTGRASYVATLIGTSVSWIVFGVSQIGLVFVVSSLFSNVVTVASFAAVPIAAVVFFGDKMGGVKIIAMVMAVWGLASYLYQHYVDDVKV
ncbi:hypothetical protein M569_15017, partial [Genlisea aurea]